MVFVNVGGDGRNRTAVHTRLLLNLRDVESLCHEGFKRVYYRTYRTHSRRVM